MTTSECAQEQFFVITAQELILAARILKDVPWQHQGRARSGVDCGGFIDLAARTAGLDLQKYLGMSAPTNYSRAPDPLLTSLTAQYCKQSPQPIPGCAVLFKFEGDKYPRHYGIVTYNRYVIHADARQGRVVEHGLRAQWARWAHSYWKIPGVDYRDVSKPA